MKQNNKEKLTDAEVDEIIKSIAEEVNQDKETRNREIIEYIIGQRDSITWLDEDLLSFLADTREKARKRNLIQAITISGEITGLGGFAVGMTGIAIAVGSVSVIMPALMLFSTALAASGGGLLLLTIILDLVYDINPDKDVAKFNKLKKDIEQEHPELKQEIKKSTKNKTSTKETSIESDSRQNNEPIKVTRSSGSGVPTPPPPPPKPIFDPNKVSEKPTNLKKVTNKTEIKPGNANVANKPPEHPNQPKVNNNPEQKTEEAPKSFKNKMAFLSEKMGGKNIQPQKPSKVEVKQPDKISNLKKQLEDQISKDSQQNNELIKVVEGSGPGIPFPPVPSNLPLQKLNIKKENQDKFQEAKKKMKASKVGKEQNKSKT